MYKPSIYRDGEIYNEGVLNKVHKYLYHGSLYKYDSLKSLSIDMGNVFQKPGFSLFTFTKKEYCIGWCVFLLIRQIYRLFDTPDQIWISFRCRGAILTDKLYKELIFNLSKMKDIEKTFYIYTIKVTENMELGFGHSSNTENCVTIRSENEIPAYSCEKMILTPEILRDHTCIVSEEDIKNKNKLMKLAGVNSRFLTPFMTNDMMYDKNKIKKRIKNAIKNDEIPIGDTEALQNYLIDNQIEIYHPTISDRIHFRV